MELKSTYTLCFRLGIEPQYLNFDLFFDQRAPKFNQTEKFFWWLGFLKFSTDILLRLSKLVVQEWLNFPTSYVRLRWWSYCCVISNTWMRHEVVGYGWQWLADPLGTKHTPAAVRTACCAGLPFQTEICLWWLVFIWLFVELLIYVFIRLKELREPVKHSELAIHTHLSAFQPELWGSWCSQVVHVFQWTDFGWRPEGRGGIWFGWTHFTPVTEENASWRQ